MLYVIPDYYKEFKCVADQCEDTCCAGWQIVIDRRSMIRYGKVKGPFRRRLFRSIRWLEGTIKQSEGKRCAFLNDNNLCDMYMALGEDSLCRTCRLYPRHIEEFEGVREISLSLSCPEVARYLMKRKEPVHFLQYERPGEETYEDFDLLLYSKLADAREVMLGILKNRKERIATRAALLLGIAHDMQNRIDRGHLFACDEVLEKYQTMRAKTYVAERAGKWQESLGQRREYAKNAFACMHKLELLREDWYGLLCEAEEILYHCPEEEYIKMHLEFAEWRKSSRPEWEIQTEQILVYFLFTYFCGAVYDGRVFAKVRMAFFSTFVLEELLTAIWHKNEGTYDQEDVTNLVYRYSRELEHSDQNLEMLETMLDPKKQI